MRSALLAHCARETRGPARGRDGHVASYNRTPASGCSSTRPKVDGRMPRVSKWDRLDSAAKNRCAPVVPLLPGRQTK
jgi:hypothetical protein